MRHLSYANVASTLALVVALSGTAYAAATITGADVVNNSLTGKDLKNNKVKSADVAGLSITDFALNGLPGARMENAQTPLTVPDGATNVFPMDTEAYDTGNMYTAPNDVMTIRKSGTYLVTAGLAWGEGDPNLQIKVRVNDAVSVAFADVRNQPDAHIMQLVALVRFQSGDQISLGTFTSTGPVAASNFTSINEVWLAAQMVSR